MPMLFWGFFALNKTLYFLCLTQCPSPVQNSHRTQMTLYAAFEHIWLTIGPHCRYRYKKHQKSVSFYALAALGSRTTLKQP